MVKDEQWYLDNLPSFAKLKNLIEDDKKLLSDMEEFVNKEGIPSVLKNEYTNVKIPKIKDRIEIYEFALNMGVKGYIIGTRSKDTNPKEAEATEKLIKAIFGDNEN